MKIMLVGNDDFSIWHFRRGIIKELIARGHEVVLATPAGEYVGRLNGLGARHVAVPVARFMSPWRDLWLMFRLFWLFRRERPDLAHTMTVKLNTYGTIAARLAGVKRIVSLLPGLGYAFMDGGGWRTALTRRMVTSLYRLSARFNHRMWFQNRDDRQLFIDEGIVPPERAILIPGSGVNLAEYSPRNIEESRVAAIRQELDLARVDKVVVMMVARVIACKGVRNFIEASQLAADWKRRVLFLLVGPADDGPDAIDPEQLDSSRSANFQWIGFQSDVAAVLSLADVVVLPSYYREGVPRVLLESMAMSKPIVTTDNVGCREVVDHGTNGYLVPVRDTPALAAAIEKIVSNDTLAASLSAMSLKKASEEYDEKLVVRRVMSELYGFPPARPLPQAA